VGQNPCGVAHATVRQFTQDVDPVAVHKQPVTLGVVHRLAFNVSDPPAPETAGFRSDDFVVSQVLDGGGQGHGWIVSGVGRGVKRENGFISDGTGGGVGFIHRSTSLDAVQEPAQHGVQDAGTHGRVHHLDTTRLRHNLQHLVPVLAGTQVPAADIGHSLGGVGVRGGRTAQHTVDERKTGFQSVGGDSHGRIVPFRGGVVKNFLDFFSRWWRCTTRRGSPTGSGGQQTLGRTLPSAAWTGRSRQCSA